MSQKIIVGRVGKSYGVFGWVKVNSFTEPTEKILEYPHWFVKIKNHWQTLNIEAQKILDDRKIIVKFREIDSPEFAKHYANLEIFVPREDLPKLNENEFYWDDLIGCTLQNCAGNNLGIVKKLMATGSNDVLVVETASGKEQLIPYLSHVIISVDIKNKKIIVDWEMD